MTKRERRAVLVAVLLAVAGCVGAAPDPSSGATGTPRPSGTTATVTDVVDGDTVDVRFPDGSTDTVRLLGVDTPEVHVENAPDEFEGVPDTAAGRACLGRHGERATEFAVARLADREVTLRFDASADRRGGYGRLLAYVLVDGESFNAALLERGHARLYDSTFRERDRYAALEAAARAENRGLWSCAG